MTTSLSVIYLFLCLYYFYLSSILLGGRVVALPYNMTDADAQAIVGKINGLLFPGGGADLNPTARTLFKTAIEINDLGQVFPVWCTCLGFEWLSQYFAGDAILSKFDAENLALPLTLAGDLELMSSKVFFEICKSLCVSIDSFLSIFSLLYSIIRYIE